MGEKITEAAPEARKREKEISEKDDTLYTKSLLIQKQMELLHQQAVEAQKEESQATQKNAS